MVVKMNSSKLKKIEIENIQNIIKKLLKQKKMNSSKLSSLMKISEATAKRFLSGNDLSLERIIQICDILELKFHDLMDLSKTLESEYYFLSVDQEIFLSKNPVHFSIILLLLKNKSVSLILSELKLDLIKFEICILELQNLDFLHFEDNEIFMKIRPGFDWQKGGPLWNTFLKTKLDQTIQNFCTVKFDDDRTFYDFAFRPMTQKSYSKMKTEIDEISKKYSQISKIERLSYSSKDLVEYSSLQIIYVE